MNIKTLTLAILAMLGTACTTTRYKQVDDKIEYMGNLPQGDFGRDKDGNVIIQQKTTARSELMIQQHLNENLEIEIGSTYFLLNECRRDVVDTRLSGSGKFEPVHFKNNGSNIKTISELGYDDNKQLVIVRRSDFVGTLEGERTYYSELKKMNDILSDTQGKCRQALRMLRVAHGLTADPMPGEKSLDDAFANLQASK